jgi:CDGSH iron-sulfur domain-containing protein 3
MYTNRPIPTQANEGTKHYCTCGLSTNKPYCTGAHTGTGKSPVAETLSKSKMMFACDCGKSNTMPYCDGAHSK